VVTGTLAGAVTGGTLGTMRGIAVASWAGTLLSWWYFRKALVESGTVPVPTWMWRGHPAGHHEGPTA
jgi:hypothetical protein